RACPLAEPTTASLSLARQGGHATIARAVPVRPHTLVLFTRRRHPATRLCASTSAGSPSTTPRRQHRSPATNPPEVPATPVQRDITHRSTLLPRKKLPASRTRAPTPARRNGTPKLLAPPPGCRPPSCHGDVSLPGSSAGRSSTSPTAPGSKVRPRCGAS